MAGIGAGVTIRQVSGSGPVRGLTLRKGILSFSGVLGNDTLL